MADLLLLLGICLVFGSLWLHRRKVEKEIGELDKLQTEIVRTKEDVGVLMKELTGVSEQVVETITEKIKTAEETMSKLQAAAQNVPIEQAFGENSSVESDSFEQATDEKAFVKQIPMKQAPAEVKSNSDNDSQVVTRVKPNREAVQKASKVIKLENRQREKEFSPAPFKLPAKHQAVYSLAEMGYTVDQIAKQLSIGKGEVALILQLKHKGEEVNGV